MSELSTSTSAYEQERRDKLQRLRELGVDPYGQRTANVRPLAEAKGLYKSEMGHDGGPEVTVAGRVMFAKRFGKLAFMTLRDETGDLQVALDKKRLGELDWQVQDLIDLGDQIVVTGPLGSTKTGETTVWAKSVAFASKALLPPPGKWHGLEDVELRYRQRYVDLWANPEVMRLAKLRTRMVAEMRSYLSGLGYVEVETPMMQIQPGGAAARPFVTHHNALDIPLYMRIAPELFLKRLLVGGFSKVFEINRNFRNEGISPRHNPEFTMLEAYEAYGSWETMADMVEGLVTHVAEKVFGTLQIARNETLVFESNREANSPRVLECDVSVGEPLKHLRPPLQTINLARPWRRVRLVDLVDELTGWRFEENIPLQASGSELWRVLAVVAPAEITQFPDAPDHPVFCKRMMFSVGTALRLKEKVSTLSPAEQLQEVYEKLIEPTLIDPTFVTHVPSVIIPLAKPNKDDPFFADVYELAINGVEISPGYTELNDPDVQQKQFTHQVGDKEEQQKVDEDFLNALRYGMPPAGGMGLGVDRLLMMLSGAESIRDVILFPLMKPV